MSPDHEKQRIEYHYAHSKEEMKSLSKEVPKGDYVILLNKDGKPIRKWWKV